MAFTIANKSALDFYDAAVGGTNPMGKIPDPRLDRSMPANCNNSIVVVALSGITGTIMF